jgi:hypothetical protein
MNAKANRVCKIARNTGTSKKYVVPNRKFIITFIDGGFDDNYFCFSDTVRFQSDFSATYMEHLAQ